MGAGLSPTAIAHQCQHITRVYERLAPHLAASAALLLQGIKLGVSSRGWASVVADPAHNRVLVDEDFQLITFDFVTEPSNAGAYLVPIHTKYK